MEFLILRDLPISWMLLLLSTLRLLLGLDGFPQTLDFSILVLSKARHPVKAGIKSTSRKPRWGNMSITAFALQKPIWPNVPIQPQSLA